jgi:hypothetical protein
VATQTALLDTLTDKLAAARSQSRRASAAGADEAEAARLRLQLAQAQGEGQALQQQLAEARAEAGGCRAPPPLVRRIRTWPASCWWQAAAELGACPVPPAAGASKELAAAQEQASQLQEQVERLEAQLQEPRQQAAQQAAAGAGGGAASGQLQQAQRQASTAQADVAHMAEQVGCCPLASVLLFLVPSVSQGPGAANRAWQAANRTHHPLPSPLQVARLSAELEQQRSAFEESAGAQEAQYMAQVAALQQEADASAQALQRSQAALLRLQVRGCRRSRTHTQRFHPSPATKHAWRRPAQPALDTFQRGSLHLRRYSLQPALAQLPHLAPSKAGAERAPAATPCPCTPAARAGAAARAALR